VLPRLGLPDAALTVLVIVAALGFPITLVLSWVFQVSPEAGIELDEGDRTPPTVSAPRALRVGTLLIATAVFAGAAWWWIPRAPAFRDAELDPDALVVLPFDVRGAGEVDYLSEGMVDLISTKLDGISGLRVVDPHATLAAVGVGSATRSVEEIGDVAERLGAGRALQGSIVLSGDALQVRASVYSLADGSRIDASVQGTADALFDVVDRLVVELVTGGVLADDARLVPLDELTSPSGEALRLYLDGVRNHRAGLGIAETLEPLARAIARDSTFALAALAAGHTAWWYELLEEARDYYELADRHQDRLGTRGRLRLNAALAAVEGRHADAITAYETFVERYPEDIMGWFRYAEELAHSGHYSGRTIASALPAYERAFELDPGMAPLYFHLAHIGGLRGDTAGLRRLASGLDSLGSDPLWPGVVRLMEGLVSGDSALVEASYRVYRAAESTLPAPVMAQSFGILISGPMEHSPGQALGMLDDFRKRALTDTARVVFARRSARTVSGFGHFEDAERFLREAEAGLGQVLYHDLAWVALHPARVEEQAVTEARDLLLATTPRPGSGVEASRHYLLARLALRLDRRGDYTRHREALSSIRVESEEVGRFVEDLASELDAFSAGLAGDPDEGLRVLLEASYWTASQRWLGFEPGAYLDGALPDRYQIFLRAELLRQAGRDEEARRWYEVAAEGPFHRGPALLGLADINARAGDPEAAAELYARVLRLWENADAELDATRASIEERLAALDRTPGGQ
jgi:tetratricopeptide (TPR) repeat protein